MRGHDQWSFDIFCEWWQVEETFYGQSIGTLPCNAFGTDQLATAQKAIVDPGQLAQVFAIAIRIPDIPRREPVRSYHSDVLSIFADLWTDVATVAAGELGDGIVFQVEAPEMQLSSFLGWHQ